MTDQASGSVDTLQYLFDSAWYLEQYPEVASNERSPLDHYLTIGAARGWNPHPLFDTSWYLRQAVEIAATEVNPLRHYLEFGAKEGLDPHPLFDGSWYFEQYPDVAAGGENPLGHYLRCGAAEGRDPHPAFNTAWYLQQNAQVASSGINPLIHYVTAGAAELRDPNPYFDTSRYLERNPGVAEKGSNPLVHYLTSNASALQSSVRRRVQVHRCDQLGDVLLITPVLRALRKKYPGDEIVITTILPEILLGNPYIDHITPSRTPREGFDETFVLEYETRPDAHIVDAYAQIAQVSVDDRTPEIYLCQNERFAANRLLREAGVRLYELFCVMQLTSGWSVRDWSVERFKEVAMALEQAGLKVVVLGKEPHPVIDFGVDLRGQTSVRVAAAIIEKCAVMVTIDSALMHMGYALRRPVISLFGCTDPPKRVPEWALPTALSSDIPCRGCHHRQPAPAVLAPQCLWESVRCMDDLSPELVITAVRSEFARAASPIASIVIPHYFKYDLLHACLSSIFRHGAERAFEVIVVANGSPASSIEQLQAWRPNVRILPLEPNRGFSGACNAGARATRGKYVVFLNDDTTVTPGWLDEMIAYFEADPKIGIVGPKLLFPETDSIQHCGTVINDQGLGEHIYRNFPNSFAGANKPRYYRALTGACLLIEKNFFQWLREFDVGYCGTGGCEDTDLCFKVLEAGRMVAYCPRSVVYHHEGLTRGLRDEYHPEDTYNRRILREKWGEYLVSDINDYRLLETIEQEEGKTWRWLREVPKDIVERTGGRTE